MTIEIRPRTSIRAIWTGRQEPAERVAERLVACLGRLGVVTSAMSSWREGQPPTMFLVPADPDAVTPRILRYSKRTAEDRPILAWTYGGWTGDDARVIASFDLRIEGPAPYPIPLASVFILEYEDSPTSTVDDVLPFVNTVVGSWDPDTVEVARDSGELRPQPPPWLRFVREKPSGGTIVRELDQGWLVLAEEQPPTRNGNLPEGPIH
jgi:hypothetical protein